MSRTLRARVHRLEREATGDTCPCGSSTVYDTIMLIAADDESAGPDVCRLCGGELPKIPFAWLQRLLAADDTGVLR